VHAPNLYGLHGVARARAWLAVSSVHMQHATCTCHAHAMPWHMDMDMYMCMCMSHVHVHVHASSEKKKSGTLHPCMSPG